MGKGKKSDVQFILPDVVDSMAEIDLSADESYLESPYTSILMSTATGDGLYTAMAKTRATFEISAHDQHGERRPVGGDPFQVSVRGAAYVYAKVIDNGNGTYSVEYKPSTSGAYTIAITLHGVPMPGSPFALTVLVPRADATRCLLRGATLKSIVARTPASFDVEFSDAFGQVSHAEDLDVYVEPRPIPHNLTEGETLPTEGIIWAIVHPDSNKLLVRAAMELDSEKIAELAPGSMVGVLATNDMPDGTRRARIMFRPNGTRLGRMVGERSPERSPPMSRSTTRTNTPINTPGRSSTPGRYSSRDGFSARGAYSARGTYSARDSARSSAPGTPGRTTPGRSASARTPRSPGRQMSPGRSPRAASPRSPGRNAPLFSNPLDGTGSRPGTPGRSGSSAPWVGARVPSFARPLGEMHTDRQRSRSPPQSMTFGPGAFTAREAGEVGWVTAAKDGKETLVIRHLKLDAGRRQAQMQLWQKQLAAEANRQAKENRTRGTNEDMARARVGPSCAHELEADKSGIGFAYGGISPGTLHAHGKLVKVHQVHYSVGRAGQYLLYVGIRNQTAPLPGSPFELTVVPGEAHPVATSLTMDEAGRAVPLQGVVGEAGSVTIVTSDRMGNRCVVGGAPLRVETKSKELRTDHADNGDGTYALQWMGEVSGKYELNVTIGDVNVTGSPTMLTLLPAAPDVPKCEISGGGLSDAVAGEKVTVLVRCKDRFSNPTTPGTSMSFGLAVAPPAEKAEGEKKSKGDKGKSQSQVNPMEEERKERRAKEAAEEAAASSLPSKDFEGTWLAEGEYEIKYTAEKAGDHELHLWCDTEGNGVRQKLPGSPFQLHVVAANASASGSLITGADAVRNTPLTAGEPLELGLYFRDDFGNACAPPERGSKVAVAAVVEEEESSPSRLGLRRGSTLQGLDSKGLRRGSTTSGGKKESAAAANAVAGSSGKHFEQGVEARLVTPHEEEIITDKLRQGDAVGTFSLRYELQVAGAYEAHFTLGGIPIKGSPVKFRVKPAQPSGRLSTLHPPVDTPSVIGVLYELTLIAEDKYTNRLDRGGANVQARALGPSASPATTVDHGDGTYGVRFTAGAVGEYRVEVRLDNVKIKGSPHLINFTEPTAAQKKLLAAMGGTAVDGQHEDDERASRDSSPQRSDSERDGSPLSSRSPIGHRS